MNYCRIIPCLDVKDGCLVKGVNFANLKKIGDPAETAAAYSEAGADELILLDITATLEKRKTLLETVQRTVAAVSIPLTVGGGINRLDDIRELLAAGVSRVSLNTGAVRNPELIRQASLAFGRERIVVAVDTRRSPKMPSGYEVMIGGGKEPAGLDVVEWVKKAENSGLAPFYPPVWIRTGGKMVTIWR